MRAVNLIPAEARRGGVGGPGRSGGAAYALLGVLAAIVVGAGVYVLAGNSVSQRKAELTRVTSEANQARAEADTLRTYTEFASLRQARAQTVASLAGSRFDWERTLRQISRVLPKDVWLTSLTGTVSNDVSADSSGGGGSSGSGLRAALPNPAVEMTGCTTSQSEVSRVMARLRLVDGVQRVSLDSSAKTDASGSSGSSGSTATGTASGCGGPSFPQFQLVVFFDELPTAVAPAPAPATGTTGATSSTAPAPAPAAAPVAQPSGSGR